MSVAFVKEESAETASETQLPERPISPHPNLVTKEGLKALEDQRAAAEAALEQANGIEDVNERRRQAAGPGRDLRYFTERLRTAELMRPPEDPDTIGFGSAVTLERDDGKIKTWKIVGEDEADPRVGTISYVSPMARALHEKRVGDEISVGERDYAITDIR